MPHASVHDEVRDGQFIERRSLKVEAIHGERFATREQAQVDYNRNRLHSTLCYLSPEQFERADAA